MPINRKKAFTLVELMVAMAVLVIMMGFLFQFIISAQRLWSSSNADASVHTQAQIVFSMFENDLQNIIVKDDAGYGIPYLVRTDVGDSANYPIGSHHNKVYCCFLVQSSDLTGNAGDIGASLVAYVFIRTNSSGPVYKLYRLILDDKFDYVNPDSNYLFNLVDAQVSTIDDSSQKLLAENVVDCNIQILNATTEATPKVARISITFFDPDKIPNYEEEIKSGGTLSSSDDRENKFVNKFHCTYFFSKIITLQ